MKGSILAFVLVAWLSTAESLAQSVCIKNQSKVVRFLSDTWFVASETVKGAARDIYESWKEERYLRDVAANRLEQLMDANVPLDKIFKILDEEGLGEYVISSSGRIPPMTGGALRKLLERNGFRHIRTNGSHQIMNNGTRNVIVPLHGNRDLGTGLVLKVIKNAGLREAL